MTVYYIFCNIPTIKRRIPFYDFGDLPFCSAIYPNLYTKQYCRPRLYLLFSFIYVNIYLIFCQHNVVCIAISQYKICKQNIPVFLVLLLFDYFLFCFEVSYLLQKNNQASGTFYYFCLLCM